MSEDYYQEIADKFIFTVKKGLLYTENDIWSKIEDGKAQIGVTDFLQRLSGDVVFVELPNKGRTVRRGEEIASFETIKAVVSITSPFDGVIIDANTILNDKPELINEDPYDEGWLALIAPSNFEGDKQQLMTADKYFELMKSKIKNELTSKKETQKLPDPILILSCSGIGKPYGTISRDATYSVVEDLKKGETDTICLSLLVIGDEEAGQKVKSQRCIAVDGCPNECSKKNLELSKANLVASFRVVDILKDNKGLKPSSVTFLDEAGRKLSKILADKIALKVDELNKKGVSK